MSIETDIQNEIRIGAGGHAIHLFRNNVGVLTDKRGVPVRFGLANDSPVINDKFKSGDLIGFRSTVITQDMVGRRIAQFLSIEVKKPGHKTERRRLEAQQRWADLVKAHGGVGVIVESAQEAYRALGI